MKCKINVKLKMQVPSKNASTFQLLQLFKYFPLSCSGNIGTKWINSLNAKVAII